MDEKRTPLIENDDEAMKKSAPGFEAPLGLIVMLG